MSKHLHLVLNAIDTLMFRDGRPFNQNDAGASEAVSVFPPYPPTIVGAVRAALWQGPQKGKWDAELLGDGTNWQADDNGLGPLEFGAPLLLKDKSPVFPVPLHIVEGKQKNGTTVRTLLAPGPELESDLVRARFPVAKDDQLEGIKPIEDRWVTLEGMKKILFGGVPGEDDLIKRTDLWQTEPRVGVGIDVGVDAKEKRTRTTTDGNLYMATHVRMRDDVSLYLSVDSWQGADFNKAMRPLAGEHRMAEIANGSPVDLPKEPTHFEDGRWCAIALSPVISDKDGKVSGLNGKIISACLGKPVVIGGWNSRCKQPIPLRRCIPAGSVFFMQGDDGATLARNGRHIGKSTEWGFGQILIGKWQEKS